MSKTPFKQAVQDRICILRAQRNHLNRLPVEERGFTKPMPPDNLSCVQAGFLVGRSSQHLCDMIHQGHLKAFTCAAPGAIKPKYQVTLHDLATFVESSSTSHITPV